MFPVLSAKTAEAGTKGDRSYCTRRVNCCTRIGALTISIFANEGYACTPCTTSFFACVCNDKSFLVTELVGSTEFIYLRHNVFGSENRKKYSLNT